MPPFLLFCEELVRILLVDMSGGLELFGFLTKWLLNSRRYRSLRLALIDERQLDTCHALLQHPFIVRLKDRSAFTR